MWMLRMRLLSSFFHTFPHIYLLTLSRNFVILILVIQSIEETGPTWFPHSVREIQLTISRERDSTPLPSRSPFIYFLWELWDNRQQAQFFFIIDPILFYIFFILCMYVCMPTWMLSKTCGSQDNLWKLFLSFVTWVLGFNSDCQAWWQMPLPAELSHQPPKTLWNVTSIYQLLPHFGCIELKFYRLPYVVCQGGPHHY